MRKKMLRHLLSGGLLCAALGMASPAQAAPITLVDHNSSVTIDPDSQWGMQDWLVDGVDHLYQQWFWYRIGNSGPEASIDTISAPLYFSANTNFYAGDDTATIRYENSQLIIELKYSLLGGPTGSGNSDVGEQIKVENKTNAVLDLHLFQYSDFDVNNTTGDDIVTMLNANSVRQYDINGGPYIGEAVSLPFSNAHEVDYFSNTQGSLNDGGPTALSNSNVAGPGDVTFAFQWDFQLAAAGNQGSAMVISKNKNVYVPEPASLVLFGMGLISAAGVARRRKTVAPQA